jgi:hypothetical protein
MHAYKCVAMYFRFKLDIIINFVQWARMNIVVSREIICMCFVQSWHIAPRLALASCVAHVSSRIITHDNCHTLTHYPDTHTSLPSNSTGSINSNLNAFNLWRSCAQRYSSRNVYKAVRYDTTKWDAGWMWLCYKLWPLWTNKFGNSWAKVEFEEYFGS